MHSEGGQTVVSYKPAQQYFETSSKDSSPHLPFVVSTVNTIENYDGLSATTSSLTYKYYGGDFYYNFAQDRRLFIRNRPHHEQQIGLAG